jgi:transcriptional regulator with XRE-family HTH domain
MEKYSKKKMAERIKEARINRFKGTVTQKEMAVLLGIPYRTYQNWETGTTSPKRGFITVLANRLKVDPAWLELGPPSRGKEIGKEIIQMYFPKKQE